MESPRLLDQVLERDLDLALMSALFVSAAFRAFVLQSAIGWVGGHSFVGVRVSETATAGETDLLLIVDLDGPDRLAVMIEDKIDAPFQPMQAERYRERGEQGIRDERWNRFVTCLCAPEGYLAGARPINEWDVYVSLEAISEWTKGFNDRHLAFIRAICTQAIAKREAGLRETSPEATAFWRAYRQLAAELLSEFSITRLADTVSDTSQWPRFGAALLPADMFVEHKAQHGRVDLTFNGLSLEALRSQLNTALPLDVSAVKTGKSAALRIAVPRINHLRPFSEQEEEVLAAFAAVERLLAIGRRMATAIPAGYRPRCATTI